MSWSCCKIAITLELDSISYEVTGILEYFNATSKLWADTLLSVIQMVIQCFALLGPSQYLWHIWVNW